MTATQSNLRLTPVVIEKLRSSSVAALTGRSPSPAEIGGLITSSESPALPPDEVHFVTCTYGEGNLWRLNDLEQKRLRGIARQLEGDGKTIIAYFRSCTRPTAAIDAEDLSAIQLACPDVPFILLVKPWLTGAVSISVYMRSGGGKWATQDYIEVPAPTGMADLSPTDLERRVDSAVREPVPADETKRVTGRKRKQLFAASAAAIVLCAAAAFCVAGIRTRARYPATASRVTPPPSGNVGVASSPKLGLAVTDRNGSLHITWNTAAKPVTTAAFGTLDIDDSGTRKTVVLLPADLSLGSILYMPRSGDTKLRMRVRNTRGEITEERIHVLGNNEARVAAGKTVPDASARSFTPSRFAAPAPNSKPPSVTNRRAPSTHEIVPTVPPSKPVPPRQPFLQSIMKIAGIVKPVSPALRTQATDAAPQARAAAPGAQTELPRSQAAADPARQRPRAEARVNQPRLPTAKIAASASLPQPTTAASRSSRPSSRPPVLTHTPVDVPAQPIREVKPERLPAWKIDDTVRVGVTMIVDEKGRVSKAALDVANNSENPLLTTSCLSAAKVWSFKPATRDGRPVASEFHLDCVFEPADAK